MESLIRQKWIKIQNIQIHYLTAGSLRNPPIILLHGGGSDSAALSWKYVIEPLSQHLHVFALDLPGYGESDRPEISDPLPFYIRSLKELMDAWELNNATITGLSLGGGIALGFTLRNPQRVQKLILVDSYGLKGDIPFPIIAYLVSHLPFLNQFVRQQLQNNRGLIKWGLRYIVHDRQRITRELVDDVWGAVKKAGKATAWEAFQRREITRRGLRTQYFDELHLINSPTLIIHGRQDRLVPVMWARLAQQRIANSQLKIFPDCGHWPPREAPDLFCQVVLRFLSTN